MDWTESYNRSVLARTAEKMINQLIKEIYLMRLTIHTDNNLTVNELGMLYRWPLYIGINTFLERLVRSIYDIDRGYETLYKGGDYKNVYFKNITDACYSYYNDNSLNINLLNKLSKLLSYNYELEKKTINYHNDESVIKKNKYTISSGVRFLKRYLVKFYLTIIRVYKKNSIAYEESKWMNLIFPIESRIIELPYNILPLDTKTRGKIKECSKKVFINNSSYFSDKIEKSVIGELAEYFVDWVDKILPYSVIEDLQSRLKFYENLLNNWHVVQVHSSVGYAYNDNYKCFAIMAKRKGAKIVGQDHGAHPPPKYLPSGQDQKKFYKGFSCLYFNDYYLTWGDPRQDPCDAWDGVDRVHSVKIFNNGSVYLKKLKKWNKTQINKETLTVLYPSGPLRNFMANLQEITPEKNSFHRINVLTMLKNLLIKYSKLRIFYKSFMGSDLSNDPIKEMLSKYVSQGRVQFTNILPINLMPKVDIVLFDMISTGFAEAIEIGVPTLVYRKNIDYELVSDKSKKINDKLHNCGVFFFDMHKGIQSFEKILSDLNGFQEESRSALRCFQGLSAYPVSKKEYLKNLNKKITKNN